MASPRVARAAKWKQVASLLLLMFLFLAQFASAAGESNSNAVHHGHGHGHYYPDKASHVYPAFQRRNLSRDDAADAADAEATAEPHPADELLQSQDADGSQSYILGGY